MPDYFHAFGPLLKKGGDLAKPHTIAFGQVPAIDEISGIDLERQFDFDTLFSLMLILINSPK
jgi:hypothetical protein